MGIHWLVQKKRTGTNAGHFGERSFGCLRVEDDKTDQGATERITHCGKHLKIVSVECIKAVRLVGKNEGE